MKKKAPLTAIQFNALAIVTLFAFMPFAIAFITSAGSDSDGSYSSSASPHGNGAIGFQEALWYHTGENYSGVYADQIPMPDNWYLCSHVENGQCDGQYDTVVPNPEYFYSLVPADSYIDYDSYFMKQNMQRFLAPGEYLGTSGNGPFGWLLAGNVFNNIEQNDALDSIRYSFFDHLTSYSCDYSGFTELELDYSLTFLYGNESKSFTGFSSTQNNSKDMRLYDNNNGHWSDSCANFLELEYDFTGFESLSINDFNGGDWANTTHIIEIQSIKRTDGAPLADTPIPFLGDTYFTFYAEHQEIDPVQANFIIRGLTTVLSAGTFLLAIGSTQYWSPLLNTFKGRI